MQEAQPGTMVRRWPQPGLCEVCRRWGSGRFCHLCLQRFAASTPRCAGCGLRTGVPLARCGSCLQEDWPFASTCCAVDYAHPWDHLVARYKYRGQVELATPLAQLMLNGPHPPVDALVPVPLAESRLAERGYNQAWELARRLGAALGLPARADVLLRPLAQAAQAAQTGQTRRAAHEPPAGPAPQAVSTRAERLRNLRAAFMVEPAQRPWLQGRQLGLVDDVMTTGATAREAAQTLLRAGAAGVHLWVLARTPAPQAAGPAA